MNNKTVTNPDLQVFTQKGYSHITHKQLDNGIYVVRLLDTSNHAVDELLDYEIQLTENTSGSPLVLQLMDARIGLPSIAYTIGRARHMMAAHPAKSPARVAIVYSRQQWVVTEVFFNLINGLHIPNLKVRLLSDKEYDQAIEWLINPRKKQTGKLNMPSGL
jgi:hypothetical protein